MAVKRLNALIAMSVTLAVICTPVHLVVGLRFTDATRLPVAASGQVVPFNVHGTDVYLTAGQSHCCADSQ
jgi:hypothetical protein